MPLVGFSPTDAGFNLGYAVAQARTLPVGVFVAMHAQIFKPDEVAKQMAEGKFYSLWGGK